jgi:hypothetical protein
MPVDRNPLRDPEAIDYDIVRMQSMSIAEASRARPLFQRLTQSQPMCTAVLAGKEAGLLLRVLLIDRFTPHCIFHTDLDAFSSFCGPGV